MTGAHALRLRAKERCAQADHQHLFALFHPSLSIEFLSKCFDGVVS
jgi:hypothetical protein